MKPLVLIITLLLLSACSKLLHITHPARQAPVSSDASLHHHISQLAKQMFSSSSRLRLNKSIAVGSFLPVEDLSGKSIPPSATLAQQIQESFVTLSSQSGMNVIEFKTTHSLKLEPNLDIMLSRDIEKINNNIAIDYFLTGTYTESASGWVVNARLIDVSNSSVVAAATDTIPPDVIDGLTGHTEQPRNTLDSQLYHLN